MLDIRAESKVWHQKEMQRADVTSYEEEPSSSSSVQCWASELSHISSPLWEPERKHARQLEPQTAFDLYVFWTTILSCCVGGGSDVTLAIRLLAAWTVVLTEQTCLPAHTCCWLDSHTEGVCCGLLGQSLQTLHTPGWPEDDMEETK